MLRGSHAVVFATEVLDSGECKSKALPRFCLPLSLFSPRFLLFLTVSLTVNIKSKHCGESVIKKEKSSSAAH